MEERNVVGYIRCFTQSNAASEQQLFLIRSYCHSHSISCERFYRDVGYQNDRHVAERWKAEAIGIDSRKDRPTFPAWDDLMLDIIKGKVDVILVDTKLRLYNGIEQKTTIDRLCQQYDVKIIEVANDDGPVDSTALKVAVYHFSDRPEARTRIPLKDIDQIYEYASHSKEWEVVALFLDTTLNHRQYIQMLLERSDFDIILVKSFYHIKRKMTAFLSAAKKLREKGVRIISVEEGEFIALENEEKEWLSKPMNVAVYDRLRTKYEKDMQQVQLDKFHAFSKYRAEKWNIQEIFIDEGAGECENLKRLVQEAKKYDLIMVDTFGKVGETIIYIGRLLNSVNIPIYSLQEGGIGIYEPEDLYGPVL